MEAYDNVDHHLEDFSTFVWPEPVRYDSVSGQQEAGLPPTPTVKVILTIHYRKKLIYGRRTGVRGETTILKEQDDKKKTTLSHLFLSDLKCIHLSSKLLSPELSNLGIEPRHHKGVIARIVTYARDVGAEIEKEKNRRAVLVPICVNNLWSIVKWICLKCKKERERKELTKEMLKGCRVNKFKDCAKCAICLEEFGVGRKLTAVRMPCSHEFHEKCMLTWLLNTPSCPLCRFNMSIF
ncbi:hypothetical protein TIFTF001_011035 [Ficus carica]|uniref:RING-type domain-containing protein n=1 Tax=Ficus carica TaxID=3494 RepID=A0AA87ZWG3_FICCA|nr:hypothetical protein TIFTF001_011035 [Ficus carica]